MFRLTRRGPCGPALIAAWLLAAPLSWAGATAPSTSPADPADPGASVPATVWHSALSRFRPGDDATARNWREANDTVTRIGGWRTYLREANAPTSAPAPASDETKAPAGQATPRPTPGGHGGHGGHGHHGAPASRTP